MAEQNFANHVKFVPPFHFYVLPVLLVNVGWSCYWLQKSHFSLWSMFSVILALAILLGFLTSRVATLTVQNRVIRDAELPALARKVLDEKLNDRKAIKQLIKNWKPDYLRA